MLRSPGYRDAITCLAIVISLIAGDIAWPHDQPLELKGKTMGPVDFRVVIYSPPADESSLRAGIQQRLDRINQLMSTYLSDSDISRFNVAGANTWIDVDPLTMKVVARALEICQWTDGAFDPTVGAAVKRWNFGPEKRDSEIPPAVDEILKLQSFVGYQQVHVRLDPPAILKLHDKAELDLSAIAKGFAVDFVAEYLSEQGATDFQVEVGGEVAVRGLTPRGVWRIGIEKPDGSSSPVAVARLTDVALATSGDYRNFYEIDGKRYSHTIDPKTCCPVENPPASCSVLYPDCMTADALATALMVMSEKAAEKFCIQNNVAALIYRRLDGSPGQYKEFRSAGFPITDNVEATREQHKSRSIWPAFVGALVVFTLAVAGMAVGAIFNNRPIRGSCGGSASNTNLDGSSSCSLCSKPVTDCPEQSVAKKR